MSKRQTLSQPNINWLQNSLLEQKWEENIYKLSWRKIADWVQWDLVQILWTAEEINNYTGDETISLPKTLTVELSEEEQMLIKVKQCASKLHEVYLRLKDEDVLKAYVDVYNDQEWQKAITDLVGWLLRNEAIFLFDILKHDLWEYWLTFSRPATEYFIQKLPAWTVWFNIKKNENFKQAA
jgi:hypothetical protein